MPKMKTNSGAKKRFKLRGDGSAKKGRATHRHNTGKKTPGKKRNLRGLSAVKACDAENVARMLIQK